MQINETAARRKILTAELRRAISLQQVAAQPLDKYRVSRDNRPQAAQNQDRYQQEIKKARISLRKHQTELTARALIAGYYKLTSRDDLDESLKKGYLAALFCSSKLITNQGKTYGIRCSRKYCTTCGNLKTVKNADKYASPLLALWEKPYFLTLTVPNVGYLESGDDYTSPRIPEIAPRDQLKKTVEEMIQAARNGWDALKKHNQRKGKPKAGAIRKIEITARPKLWYYKGKRYGRDFHPHLHFIVDSEQTGEFLKAHWLNHFKNADPKAQDLKPIETPAAFLELFKYTQKVTGGKKGEKRMYPAAMIHEINRVLYKRRTWQPLGTALGIVTEDELNEIESEAAAADLENGSTYVWEPENANYFDTETGEIFANYYTPDVTRERYGSPGAEIWYRANADYLKLALSRWEMEHLLRYNQAIGGDNSPPTTQDNDKLLISAYAFLILSEENQGRADDQNNELRDLIVKFEAHNGPISSWNAVKLAATLDRQRENEKNSFISRHLPNLEGNEQTSPWREALLRPAFRRSNTSGTIQAPKTGDDLHQ
jgi:hypothetical protein